MIARWRLNIPIAGATNMLIAGTVNHSDHFRLRTVRIALSKTDGDTRSTQPFVVPLVAAKHESDHQAVDEGVKIQNDHRPQYTPQHISNRGRHTTANTLRATKFQYIYIDHSHHRKIPQ